ncbi:MAG: nucleoside deaminase [Deltaproteobacteria bacterium]|nr:nucleoside deaminase [Deltaproteobacteria bacterium]
MNLAIEEAKISLKEGNSGFGALLIKGRDVISKAHDTDKTSGDPTRHAEMNVIRSAAAELGGGLSGCFLVSTHEPCPMCSTAILWSGISEVAYGYPISDAIKQGRRRVDVSIKEIFQRAGKNIVVHDNVLHDACALLYNRSVRYWINQLRDADEKKLKRLARDLTEKRLNWYSQNYSPACGSAESVLNAAYRIFLEKLGVSQDQAKIVSRNDQSLVLHSSNFCPTLEACIILELDTRFICRHLTEKPTTDLLRQVHPKLRFSRNYDKLRPYCSYCEEMIILDA